MRKYAYTVFFCVLTFGTVRAADFFVDQLNSTPGAPYDSWDNAAVTITDAVGEAREGDTIYIAPGIYTGAAGTTTVVPIIGKLLRLIGTGATRDEVVIDGEGQRCGISIYRHGSVTNVRARLQNLTVRNGYSTRSGGGVSIYPDGTEAVTWGLDMVDCAVVSNVCVGTAPVGGGGVGVRNSKPTISLNFDNCEFNYNIATNSGDLANYIQGGGLNLQTSSNSVVRLNNCVVNNNWAPMGGGLSIDNGLFEIYNTEFRENVAGVSWNAYSGGGGIYVYRNARFDIRNCLFAGNISPDSRPAGGIALFSNEIDRTNYVRNCTFWGNKTRAIYQRNWTALFPPLHMYNSILYGNDPDDISYASKPEVTNRFSNCSFAATSFSFNVVLEDVIAGDPMFADPENGDFHLMARSPAVGSGFYESWMDEAVDLDGKPRITPGLGVDMGAYAFRATGSLILIR